MTNSVVMASNNTQLWNLHCLIYYMILTLASRASNAYVNTPLMRVTEHLLYLKLFKINSILGYNLYISMSWSMKHIIQPFECSERRQSILCNNVVKLCLPVCLFASWFGYEYQLKDYRSLLFKKLDMNSLVWGFSTFVLSNFILPITAT